MQEVRFGFIGSGQLAKSSAKDISAHSQGTLSAVQDLSLERANELADEFDISNRYTEAADLFADPNVDAVYIAVPNKFHAPLAIQALEAGKHVLLEKPFAMSLEEGKQVATAVEKSGKVFTVGMNQRFTEDHQKVKFLVEEGVLGEIYHAKAFWYRRSGIPKLGTWFGNKAMAGGGALYDIGVHALDLCLYLLNNYKPVSVFGTTYTRFGNRGLGEGNWGKSDYNKDIVFDVDDFATALIKFEDGATVEFGASWACHMEAGNDNGVHLYGTEAGSSTKGCKLFRKDPLRTDYDVVENVAADLKYPHASRFHNFINAINGTEDLCCTIEQALTIQKILDGIAESSKTGNAVEIS